MVASDDERERIKAEARADADLHNRVSALENKVKEHDSKFEWFMRVSWTGIAYLGAKFAEFILGGGSLK